MSQHFIKRRFIFMEPIGHRLRHVDHYRFKQAEAVGQLLARPPLEYFRLQPLDLRERYRQFELRQVSFPGRRCPLR